MAAERIRDHWNRKRVCSIVICLALILLYSINFQSYEGTKKSPDVKLLVGEGALGAALTLLPLFVPTRSDTWLTMESYAQLGNNLYEYAAMMGVGRRNGRYVFVNEGQFPYVREAFQLSVPVHSVSVLDWARVWDPMVNHTWTYNMTNHLARENITLGGSFQSFIYFQDIKNHIRREFTFRRNVTELVDSYFAKVAPEEWRGLDFVRVGIHIRHTDLLDPEYAKYGFFFPHWTYFSNAMAYFKKRHKRIQFIVASDDIQFSRRFFQNFTEKIIFSSENSPGVDMALLSACDHVIVTMGTYGWWVGWLNRGTTVYMADFPVKHTWAYGFYLRDQYIPPRDAYNNWIGITQDVPPDLTLVDIQG